MSEGNETKARRVELKRAYGAAYTQLSAILFHEDPIGINFEDNTDEYEPEVDTILPRLRHVHSVDDVSAIIHEEFVKWFEASVAGPPEKYHVVAERVWREVVPLLRPPSEDADNSPLTMTD
jgi:hypothetical protein